MKYDMMPAEYKTDRLSYIFHCLNTGVGVSINRLFLEELKILKFIYGTKLKKDKGVLFLSDREVV